MAFLSRRLQLPSLLPHHLHVPFFSKTTSAEHVASRHIDHTFEKLMRHRKRYLLASHLARLLLSSPSHSLPLRALSSLPVPFPFPISPSHFLRRLPHIFSINNHPPLVRLTPSASSLSLQESSARSSSPFSLLLLRLLSMSPSRSLPLRALLKVRLPLGLPDHLQTATLDPHLFLLRDNPRERNTHLLSLSPSSSASPLVSAVDRWRTEAGGAAEVGPYGFPQRFPPGMRLKKSYRAKVREWQALPYVGPFESRPIRAGRRRRENNEMEKRAVGIAHEFLSLTVEKAVEVEEISHFRKWFGIDLNIRDLFLDHPGIFYLSTKGGRHTVFLREAYDRGRLVEPNPVYVVRRKMLELVMLGQRGMPAGAGGGGEMVVEEEEECKSSDEEEEEEEGFDPVEGA